MRNKPSPTADTRDPAEIARFDALGESWWDAKGPMAVLHRFNPVRVAYIRDRVCERFGRDPLTIRPLAGLSMVDIGCGGGLLSEPMARMGADVTGVDPAPTNIVVASRHAEAIEIAESGCQLAYVESTIEALVASGKRYDVVLAMEVVEHVADVEAFIAACAAAAKPGGLVIMATLNRTLKAFALAIIGAEYVLGWLPRGTHQWERFIRPDELGELLMSQGLQLMGDAGVVYDLASGTWSLSDNTDVNYMVTAGKLAVSELTAIQPQEKSLSSARQRRRPAA